MSPLTCPWLGGGRSSPYLSGTMLVVDPTELKILYGGSSMTMQKIFGRQVDGGAFLDLFDEGDHNLVRTAVQKVLRGACPAFLESVRLGHGEDAEEDLTLVPVRAFGYTLVIFGSSEPLKRHHQQPPRSGTPAVAAQHRHRPNVPGEVVEPESSGSVPAGSVFGDSGGSPDRQQGSPRRRRRSPASSPREAAQHSISSESGLFFYSEDSQLISPFSSGHPSVECLDASLKEPPKEEKEMVEKDTMTDIVGTATGFHCTRCSKPPLPGRITAADIAERVGSSCLSRKRDRGKDSKVLDGMWTILSEFEKNASPFLHRLWFHKKVCIDLHGNKWQLEVTPEEVRLGGGAIFLEGENLLHRDGKNGLRFSWTRGKGGRDVIQGRKSSSGSASPCRHGRLPTPAGLSSSDLSLAGLPVWDSNDLDLQYLVDEDEEEEEGISAEFFQSIGPG